MPVSLLSARLCMRVHSGFINSSLLSYTSEMRGWGRRGGAGCLPFWNAMLSEAILPPKLQPKWPTELTEYSSVLVLCEREQTQRSCVRLIFRQKALETFPFFSNDPQGQILLLPFSHHVHAAAHCGYSATLDLFGERVPRVFFQSSQGRAGKKQLCNTEDPFRYTVHH